MIFRKKEKPDENDDLDGDDDDDDGTDNEKELVQRSVVESKGENAEATSSPVETSDVEMEDESESSDDDEEDRAREVSEKVIDFSQDETGSSLACSLQC